MAITKMLNEAATPTISVDGEGVFLWANRAAKKVFKLPRGVPHTLGALLSRECSRAILGTSTTKQVAAAFLNPKLTSLNLTICVWEMAAGGPGGERFLLSFKGVPQRRGPDPGERERFLSTVAHDLKNPLGAIFGYCDALLDSSVGEGLTDKHRHILGRVRSTASRAVELVRNAQHVAYLEALGGRLQRPPNDLNAAVNSVVEYTWRDEAVAPKLTVSLRASPIIVGIERTELERVIANLFINALKYTPSSAHITLRTYEEGEFGCFEINNTAPAILPEEQAGLFEKFKRGSTSVGVAGSGLGLYIVKLISESVGGAVALRSNAGEGTTFTVRLPLVEAITI